MPRDMVEMEGMEWMGQSDELRPSFEEAEALQKRQKGWLTETKRGINKQAILGKSLVQAVMRCEGNKNNNGKYLNSTLYISGIVPHVLGMLPHLFPITILWGRIIAPNFNM